MKTAPVGPERRSQMFWVVEDTRVRYLKGWACEPNDDVWWVPEAGYSLSVKHHLFATELQALNKLKANLTLQAKGIAGALANIEHRLKQL